MDLKSVVGSPLLCREMVDLKYSRHSEANPPTLHEMEKINHLYACILM